MSENLPPPSVPPSATPKRNINNIMVTLALAQLEAANYPMTVTIKKVRSGPDKWQYQVDMKRDK